MYECNRVCTIVLYKYSVANKSCTVLQVHIELLLQIKQQAILVRCDA